MKRTPSCCNRRPLRSSSGVCNEPCIVGATRIWVRPWPRRPNAEANAAVTTVSATPAAILPMVL